MAKLHKKLVKNNGFWKINANRFIKTLARARIRPKNKGKTGKNEEVLQAYCPLSLLNLGVRQLPLRHWGHKGVVGYPYCGINAHGWD